MIKPMRRTSWRAVPLLVALGLALWGCNGPNRGTATQPSASSGFNVVVTASPNVLRAVQKDTPGGCGVIQVKVFDTQGNLVDGAPVTVASTLGKLTTTTGSTTRGVFTTPLCALNDVGTSIITATVEDAVATTLVTIF